MRRPPLRHFSADPLNRRALRADAWMREDQREHPVVQLLQRRKAERSQPGNRADGRRLALVIEGGGMRGVVSAGMTAALEQLGVKDTFDEVHGASAGAFSGTFLLAGQATYLTGLYQHGFGDPRFVSLRRVLAGKPLFDLDYVIDEVWTHQRPLQTERVLASATDLHITATDVETTEIVDLTGFRDAGEIKDAMRASSRLPWLAGGPVVFRGRRYFDATLAEAIPIHAAQRSATDILVLQTRPHGVAHARMSGGLANLTDRYLTKFNPALVALRRTRSERYDALTAELARRATESAAGAGTPDHAGEPQPNVCVIRPPAGAMMVGQVETSLAKLATAGSHGFRATWMALTGTDPELISAPRAVI
jgi:predicted patatin/cPLA2 family phospholipase